MKNKTNFNFTIGTPIPTLLKTSSSTLNCYDADKRQYESKKP